MGTVAAVDTVDLFAGENTVVLLDTGLVGTAVPFVGEDVAVPLGTAVPFVGVDTVVLFGSVNTAVPLDTAVPFVGQDTVVPFDSVNTVVRLDVAVAPDSLDTAVPLDTAAHLAEEGTVVGNVLQELMTWTESARTFVDTLNHESEVFSLCNKLTK